MASVDRQAVLTAVGGIIASRRHSSGLSQEQLAERCGLHRTYIGAVERGIRNPTVTTLAHLALGLSCSASELLAEAGL
ncbi:MAG TPA: helix-turn-helix transcriptional regulator [Acidimicrobiales bacterium]|nr:helix-turn-helix transcriptional regulator [Acidimicrobiales bacterium]